MGSASGRHLSPDDKNSLLPNKQRGPCSKLRRKYFYYLHEDNDQYLSLWAAWLTGVPALFCLLSIFLGHFMGSNAPFLFWAHWAAVMSVVANLCSYVLLTQPRSLRGRLQKFIAERIREVCPDVLDFIGRAMTKQIDDGRKAQKLAAQTADQLARLDPAKRPDL